MSNKKVNFKGIPDSLKNRNQWLVWRLEKRGGKWTKVPYQPNGKRAKSNDPSTWNDFETCRKAYETGTFDGLGIVLTDGVTGLDLDHCVGSDEQIEKWAQEVLDQFSETYIEKSPSKEGFHILCEGEPIKTGAPKWIRESDGVEQGIEIYDHTSPRYFTVTGDVVNEKEIVDCRAGLDWLYGEYFADEHGELKQNIHNAHGQLDFEVVRKALSCIPSDERKMWIDIGHGLKKAGVPFEIYDEWSRNSVKYDANDCAERWTGFKPNRIGIGTVFDIAKQYRFEFPSNSTQKSESIEPPDWSKSETFGDPLLFGEIETPEITSEFLPPWVRDYVDAVAASTQTPVGVVAMLALAVISSCVQKRFIVSPHNDEYIEPLSLWVLVALPPASRKTAILKALREPIIEWEREELKRLMPEIERQKAEHEVINAQIKKLTKEAYQI